MIEWFCIPLGSIAIEAHVAFNNGALVLMDGRVLTDEMLKHVEAAARAAAAEALKQ